MCPNCARDEIEGVPQMGLNYAQTMTKLTAISSFLRLCPKCAPTGFASAVLQETL